MRNPAQIARQDVGFTLVELLVVVAVIAVMTGAMVPGFSNYIDSQNVAQAQEQIKSDLYSAQNSALTGSLANDPNVKYWGMLFSAGSTSYSFITTNDKCCDAASCAIAPVVRKTSEELPASLVVRTAPKCVLFSIKNGDAFTPDGSAKKIIVGPSTAASTDNKCRRTEYNDAGLIFSASSNKSCS